MLPLSGKEAERQMQTRREIAWNATPGLEDTLQPRDKSILQQIRLKPRPEDEDRWDRNKASSFTQETDVTYQTNQRDA